MAPVLVFLFFSVLEGSLLVFSVGAFRYAASQGAIQDAELGDSSNADTTAIGVIQASPGVTASSISRIEIYRLMQSGGQLTVDTTKVNTYPTAGSPTVNWPPSARNVRNGFTDFLGVTIYYQYQWKSGKLLGASALELTQSFNVRIEPQTY